MTYIHIHAPAPTAKSARAQTYPDCKKRTRMLNFFTPWYGWHATCIKCGREWYDAECAALPFARGARKRNIDAAKSMWRRLPPQRENHFGLDE